MYVEYQLIILHNDFLTNQEDGTVNIPLILYSTDTLHLYHRLVKKIINYESS